MITAVTVHDTDSGDLTVRVGDIDVYPGWPGALEIVRILKAPAEIGGTTFVVQVRDEPDGEIFALSLHDVCG